MGRSIRVGIFVLVALGIFVWFIFKVGNAESRFRPTYHVRAEFSNVSGLEAGAEVRLGGLRAGTVRDILLPKQSGEHLVVLMDVSPSAAHLIRQDSVASINAEGLVGAKYVEVSPGSKDAPELAPDSTVQSAPPLDVSDLINKANQILDTTQDSLTNLESAAVNVSSIASKVNTGRGTLGALINDKSVYQQANGAVAALHEDAEALKHNFFLRGYFQKRGFADPADIKKHSIAKLPETNPEKVFTFDPQKIFAGSDSAKLKGQKTLDATGSYLESQTSTSAVIEASAGPKGEAEEDLALSQSRAEAVRSYLLEHYKLEDRRLKILGLGKTASDATLRVLVFPSSETGPGGE